MRAKCTAGFWGSSLMLLMLIGCSSGGGDGVPGDSDTSDGVGGSDDSADTGEGGGSDDGTAAEQDVGSSCIPVQAAFTLGIPP